jgi:hypothetical protein
MSGVRSRKSQNGVSGTHSRWSPRGSGRARVATLVLAALAAVASGALAATRAGTEPAPSSPRLTIDAAGPLFEVAALRHRDRVERCVAVTNEGPGDARGFVLGRVESGDLAEHLAVAITRGCGGTVLFSGRLADLATVADGEWPAGERRRLGIAVEVAGSDAEVQGRRAVHEFGFAVEAAPRAEPPAPGGGGARDGGVLAGASGAAASEEGATPAPTCSRLSFAPTRGRRRPVLIKRHRVDARVTAKLILRIYGAAGQQRLVLVTGLRVGRKVLPGRRWGRVAYRIGDGAAVTSRRRPFRVRIAPGALRPGRNVVRVTVVPRHGRPVHARYVLTIDAARAADDCEIG